MPSLRQVIGVTLFWAFVAWFGAVLLSNRLSERAVWEAMTWYYALRAPLVAAGLAFVSAPLLCRDVGGAWIHLRFPRRAQLAKLLLWGIQSLLLGLLVGTVGTFLLLFFWPNEMQNDRWDAWKWSGWYWYNHATLFGPVTMVGGLGSTWLGQRLKAQTG